MFTLGTNGHVYRGIFSLLVISTCSLLMGDIRNQVANLKIRDMNFQKSLSGTVVVDFFVKTDEPNQYNDPSLPNPIGNGTIAFDATHKAYRVEYSYSDMPRFPTRNTLGYNDSFFNRDGNFRYSRLKIREGNFSSSATQSILLVYEDFIIKPDNSYIRNSESEMFIKVNGPEDDVYMMWLSSALSTDLVGYYKLDSLVSINHGIAKEAQGNLGLGSKGTWTIQEDLDTSLIRQASFVTKDGFPLYDMKSTGSLRCDSFVFPKSTEIEMGNSNVEIEIGNCRHISEQTNKPIENLLKDTVRARLSVSVVVDNRNEKNDASN